MVSPQDKYQTSDYDQQRPSWSGKITLFGLYHFQIAGLEDQQDENPIFRTEW